MLTDLISHGKIPSKIAIGNDISRMRMLLGLNEFPQTAFLNLIGGFSCYVFCLQEPDRIKTCDRAIALDKDRTLGRIIRLETKRAIAPN
ncbi:hypothetical protein QUA35_24400 [Microcoleus sp. N9_B2]|uniref:hypothetical protein n=1 Tax=unclassified Microcoleus TaxID=2642155 RepID=UPI002FD1B010